MITSTYYPNRVRAKFTTSSAVWQMIASDGTGHDSYAAMGAAGKVPFPGDTDQFPTGIPSLTVSSENGSGAPGDDFYIKTNTILGPTDDNADMLVQTGTTVTFPGVVKSVWIRKITAGDEVFLLGQY